MKSWISLICAEQIWYIPKIEKIYLWSANMHWFIHGIACDDQRYPWYISKHWYIPGISLVYAKTRKLINGYQIPDGKGVIDSTVADDDHRNDSSINTARKKGEPHPPFVHLRQRARQSSAVQGARADGARHLGHKPWAHLHSGSTASRAAATAVGAARAGGAAAASS